MALQQFLKSLGIEDAGVTTDSSNHSLVLDEEIVVDIIQQRDQLVFLSPVPLLSDQQYRAMEQMKTAMAWSLAQEPAQICLAQENNHLLVQTLISAAEPEATLNEALNAHCRFVDKLNQLTLSSEAKAYQHEVILP